MRGNSTALPVHAVVTVWLWRIVGSFIVCAGTVGNVVVVSVFKRKTMRRTPLYIAVNYLSIVDLFYLYVVLFPGIVSSIVGFDVRAISSATCGLFWFFIHTCGYQSLCTLAILVVERTMATTFPLTSPKLTKKRITLELTISTLINSAINFHIILGRKAIGEGPARTCIYGGRPVYLLFVNRALTLINILRAVIPLTVIMVCNVALILTMRKSRKELARFSQHENNSGDGRVRDLRLNMNSTVFILLATSVQFAIFALPIFLFMCILRIGPDYKELNTPALRSIYSLLLLLSCFNVGMNCFTYYVSSSKFRRELAQTIGRKSTRMNASTTSQTQLQSSDVSSHL